MSRFAVLNRGLSAVLVLTVLVVSRLQGSPLGYNNILLSISHDIGASQNRINQVLELTPSGHLVQTIPFNYNGGSYPQFEWLRDIVVDSSGGIDAVNGFQNLFLTRYNPASNTFTHRTFPNWAVFDAGIATYRNFIFLLDNSGGAINPLGGVQRFNTADNTFLRLGGHGFVLALAMGLDGRLYASYDTSGSYAHGIDVYNPITGVWLYDFELPQETIDAGALSRFCVDRNGKIFSTDGRTTIFRLSRNGAIEAKKVIPMQFEEFTDIDIDENGRLILCTSKTRIFIGNATLTNFTSFTAFSDPDHAYSLSYITFAKHVPTATPAPLITSTTSTLGNISSRLKVETGDRVGIAGFIITGTGTKKIVLRGIGPSLYSIFRNAALRDTVLELHDHSGNLIASNDDWLQDPAFYDVYSYGLGPQRDEESALIQTLAPGSYTAILRGKNNGTGIGLVEIYDVDGGTATNLGNISTRGYVDRGDNVMIGGFIVNGKASAGEGAKVVVRGIGPSLTQSHVAGALQDPTLELYNAFGWRLASNDNWRDTQATLIQAVHLAPLDNRESAILATLSSGAYTTILRGKNNTSGIGLVEVYSIH